MHSDLDAGLAGTLVIVFIDFTLRARRSRSFRALRDFALSPDMAVWMPPGIMLILVPRRCPRHGGGRTLVGGTGRHRYRRHLLSGRKLLWSVGAGTVAYIALMNWL